MSIQLLVNAILTALLPVLIGFVCWVYRLNIQRMPEQQRLALEQFTRMAVRKVEQEHKNALDKRLLASAFTADLFRAFKLPIPSQDAINVFIEAAVYDISSHEERPPS